MTTRRIMGALAIAGAATLLASGPAAYAADMPKVVLGMSGWTGFAPLSLAEEARLFKKPGVDVEIKFIPQKERHLTVAAGATQAELGRASCRERVCPDVVISVVAGSIKKET